MVRVIMGVKGSGKTKQLIDLVNTAVGEEAGNVVCLERGSKLTYDINHKARLIDTKQFDIHGYRMLRGFVTGLYAGDYDISHMFIDSLFKVARNEDLQGTEIFLDWLDEFGEENNIKFTVTISAEIQSATDGIKKYFQQ